MNTRSIGTQIEPIERCDQGIQCCDNEVCVTKIRDFKIVRCVIGRAANFVRGEGLYRKGRSFQTRRHYVSDVANCGYIMGESQYNKNDVNNPKLKIIWPRKRKELTQEEIFIETSKKKIKIIDDRILSFKKEIFNSYLKNPEWEPTDPMPPLPNLDFDGWVGKDNFPLDISEC